MWAVLNLLGSRRQLIQPEVLLGRCSRTDCDGLLSAKDNKRIVLCILRQQGSHGNVAKDLESGIDGRLAGVDQDIGELEIDSVINLSSITSLLI